MDPAAAEALRAKIATMMKLADSTINTVRRIAWELRPSVLDDLGLVEAIEWQARQFEARTGIVCQRTGFIDDVVFNQEQATAIFRIFQEALTNILRHADATRVEITMAQEAGEFILAISDNGRGITAIEKSGLGILGMQERVRLVGGTIQIHGLEGRRNHHLSASPHRWSAVRAAAHRCPEKNEENPYRGRSRGGSGRRHENYRATWTSFSAKRTTPARH